MSKKLASKIIYIVLWLVIMLFSSIINFVYGLIINRTVGDISELAGISTLLLLPLIITFLPLLLVFKFKQSIIKSFIISFGLYVAILFACYFSVGLYFNSFTRDKWNRYENHRYLMIDDLEKSYKLIGMTKLEIIDLLGTHLYWEENNGDGEYIIKYWTNESKYKGNYYILFLKDDLVVRTVLNKVD